MQAEAEREGLAGSVSELREMLVSEEFPILETNVDDGL